MYTTEEYLRQLMIDKQNIASLLKERGVDVKEDATFTEMATTIEEVPSVPVPSPDAQNSSKIYKFYDYQGNVIYSYTKEEIDALTELPAVPDRTNDDLLTDGWNWTLEDLKTINEPTDVGPCYKTPDNTVKIYLEGVPAGTEARLSSPQYSYNQVSINWGDGVIENHNTNNKFDEHTYTEAGDYIIIITDTEYSNGDPRYYLICDLSSYTIRNYVTRIDTGEFIKEPPLQVGSSGKVPNLREVNMSHSQNTGHYCYSQIPFLTAANGHISSSMCQNCLKLKHISIGKDTSEIDSRAFSHSGLESIALHTGLQKIWDYAFADTNIKELIIPNTVTTFGEKICDNSNLYKIKLPKELKTTQALGNLPNLQELIFDEDTYNLKIIPSNFITQSNLKDLILPSCIEIIGSNAFHGRLQNLILPHDSKIKTLNLSSFYSSSLGIQNELTNYIFTIPNSVESLISTLSNITANEIILSDNIKELSYALFSNNHVTKKVIMPKYLQTISVANFIGMADNLQILDFSKNKQIPVMTKSSSALSNEMSELQILVPVYLLDDWKVSPNWDKYIPYLKGIGQGINCKIDSKWYLNTSDIHIHCKNYNMSDNTIIEIEVDNQIINYTKIDNDNGYDLVIPKINQLGIHNISMIINDNNYNQNEQYTVNVLDTEPVFNYTVENVPDAQYGFELNTEDNMYYNNNTKQGNSCAISKIHISDPSLSGIKITINQDSENNYDYGYISQINTPLDVTNTIDNDTKIAINFKGCKDEQIFVYPVIPQSSEYDIYIKYRKDSGGDRGTDTLKFKIESNN